jgi:transcriptional regulator
MYIPQHFAEHRPEDLHRIIHDYPFGILVSTSAQGLDADHIPFEFDSGSGSHGVLTAHVARANPLWQRCPSGTQVLVVFQGPQAYVSPSWYPSKHEEHRQVPTWNYQVVHAHGTLTILDDDRFTRGVVARLTRRHEAGEPVPWKLGDAAPGYVDELLHHVVGIQIDITSLVGKFKLSQNKEARDQQGAADNLETRGHVQLAQAMRSA